MGRGRLRLRDVGVRSIYIDLFGQFNTSMLSYGLLQQVANLAMGGIREQSSRKFFGETFFLVVGIADWHLEHGFLQPLKLLVRVRPNQLRCPFFEPDWS